MKKAHKKTLNFLKRLVCQITQGCVCVVSNAALFIVQKWSSHIMSFASLLVSALQFNNLNVDPQYYTFELPSVYTQVRVCNCMLTLLCGGS